MYSLSGTGTSVLGGLAGHLADQRAGDVTVLSLESDHLAGELAVAALLQRVGGLQPPRLRRPGGEVVAAALGNRRVDVEQADLLGALTHCVGDAVHAGVTTADDDHVLVLGGDHVLGRGLAPLPPLGAGHGAVALVEVLHGEVDAVEVAARDLDVALDPGADRQNYGVVVAAQVLDADLDPDLDVAAELDPLGREHVSATLDDPLLELGVGNAEAEQPAEALVALEDDHLVADLVELVGGRQTGRARADDGDRSPRPVIGRVRRHPAFTEGVVDRPVLDLLDHHRVVVDRQHAGGLAGRRADQPGELGEVVGRVQLVDRPAPVAGAGEVVPIGDQVAERAGVVAEGHPTVHAAGGLLLELILGQRQVDLLVVAHALVGIALRGGHAVRP